MSRIPGPTVKLERSHLAPQQRDGETLKHGGEMVLEHGQYLGLAGAHERSTHEQDRGGLRRRGTCSPLYANNA